MSWNRSTVLVLLAALAALALGTAPTPLWDEDEARFAAIARTMVETGDWIVPTFNGTLAVDKPVLMHWCMAACMSVFGINEFAARLPSVIATLLTALALLRAGRRWFDDATGAVAALAYVGCLLVAIEAHAATPDAILTALTAWATLLAAEGIAPGRDGRLGRLTISRAARVGLLLGMAVVCKGPVGFVGPLAVLGPWAWWLAVERRLVTAGRRTVSLGGIARATLPALGDALRSLRPIMITAAAVAAAAPWYVAVTLRTEGAWTAGFFFVHNVGRFMAPMEKHSGGALFHPLAMLVGFYPWSCFLPFAVAVAGWRVWKRNDAAATIAAPPLLLLLAWMTVWVGAFSAAATKLPNYVQPAYPAAALLVAAVGVAAARRATAGSWPHPRWMATGLICLACGGLITAATVIVAGGHGLPGGEPAAVLGLVPLAGAIACGWLALRQPMAAVKAFTITGLAYTALAVGPAQWWLAGANTLPAFVRTLQSDEARTTRLGTYQLASPNVVFYANDRVMQAGGDMAAARQFLMSGTDAVLLVPAPYFAEIESGLPPGCGVVARTRPVFRRDDVLAVGCMPLAETRTAAVPEEIVR
jgi:4-amino-4-deoxy-L-arabinose transferase-like glycosyltransferase